MINKYPIIKRDEMLMWIVKRKQYNICQLRDEIPVDWSNAWGFSKKLEKMGFVKSLGKGRGYKVLVSCKNYGKID